jgi:hypothetical protein
MDAGLPLPPQDTTNSAVARRIARVPYGRGNWSRALELHEGLARTGALTKKSYGDLLRKALVDGGSVTESDETGFVPVPPEDPPVGTDLQGPEP